VLAENKLVNETVKRVLKLSGIVGSVDNVAVVRGVGGNLGSKLESEELDNIYRTISLGFESSRKRR
jgi:hypothetical protein